MMGVQALEWNRREKEATDKSGFVMSEEHNSSQKLSDFEDNGYIRDSSRRNALTHQQKKFIKPNLPFFFLYESQRTANQPTNEVHCYSSEALRFSRQWLGDSSLTNSLTQLISTRQHSTLTISSSFQFSQLQQ